MSNMDMPPPQPPENGTPDQALVPEQREHRLTELKQIGGERVSEKNLEMVRNILFGEQVRESERKHASLERFIRVSVSALNEETHKKLDELRHELNLLRDMLREETRNRKDYVTGARTRFEAIEQRGEELNQRVSHEVSEIGQRMDSLRKEMLEQLQQAAEQLRHDKADRKAVAALLNGMAQQLYSSGDEQHD